MIRKSNELIQNSRFSLTIIQQRVVLYAIARIMPWDEDFKEYEFDIREFCKSCDISIGGGHDYKLLQEAVWDISKKSADVILSDGRKTIVRWIEKPYIDERKGIISIRFDKDMKPFLLELKKNYTEYELSTVMRFRSKYSIRLYEFVKSLHYDEFTKYERTFDIDELRERLDAEKYTTWDRFKVRVLEPAITEINEFSDKNVTYETQKRGKKIEQITLRIETKSITKRLKASAKPKQRNKKETE